MKTQRFEASFWQLKMKRFDEIEASKPVCTKCGKRIWGERCQCELDAEAAEQARRLRDAELAARLGGARAFRLCTEQAFHDKRTLAKAKRLYLSQGKNLYVYGGTGTGKTHLAAALIRQTQCGTLRKVSGFMLLSRGRSADVEAAGELVRTLGRQRHVALDDLDPEAATPYGLMLLRDVLDAREAAELGGMIITSCLSLDGLAKACGDRMASRIAGMCEPVRLDGPDWRLQKNLI